MANIKSAKKRVLVNQKKANINKSHRSSLRTKMKNTKIALETGAENIEATVQNTISTIDKAVSKGLLHKNTASRKKSKLALSLNKISK
ncbi:MAG: 30S ribosomal protein S20 [Oscillospiraceae bacterium]